MAYIQERKTDEGKTHFRVQVRLKGFPLTSATFERKTDAKLWAQQTEAAMRDGRHFKTAEAKKHTVGDLIDRYIESVIPTKPKNGERRTVPVRGLAQQLLQQYAQTIKLDIGLLFPSKEDHQKPMDLRFPWEKALTKAGIKNFRFHDCRHSCASYLLMNGASLAEIAEVLGHKTLAMVKRYSHISELHSAKVVERMNQQIFCT